MEYEEFIEVIKKYTNVWTESVFKEHMESYRWREKRDHSNKDPYCFYEQASVGGVSGGSCWDSSDPQPYSNPDGYEECKKDFDKVYDQIVLELYPNIPYIKYKIIYDACVMTETYSEPEYYGNNTEYYVLYCELKNFWEKLNENRWE